MYLNRLEAQTRIIKSKGGSRRDRDELATLRRINDLMKAEHSIAKIESVPAVSRFGRAQLERMQRAQAALGLPDGVMLHHGNPPVGGGD